MDGTTWYDVYVLIDPFDVQAFYVGITDNFIERYIQHIKMKDDNEAKNARIAKIIERGGLPIMNRVLRVQGQEGAFKLEALWIDICRIYKQPLTNRELRIYANDASRQAILDGAMEAVRKGKGWIPYNPIPADYTQKIRR